MVGLVFPTRRYYLSGKVSYVPRRRPLEAPNLTVQRVNLVRVGYGHPDSISKTVAILEGFGDMGSFGIENIHLY
jgi:hypothetical protein